MTKLYYNHPIEALYMSYEFGVKTSSWCCLAEKLLPDERKDLVDDYLDDFEGTYFIDPDSLPIFEPREGDESDGFVFHKGLWVRKCAFETDGGHDVYRKPSAIKTEKRGGKPFFWPKEQANDAE